MGILDFLRFAAAPAAEAVGAYGQAQEAEKRQGLVDQIQRELAQSQIQEAKARSDYYEGIGRQTSYPWTENAQTGDLYNRNTGELRPGTAGAGKATNGTPYGGEHFDPSQNAVGVTMIHRDGTSSFLKTRDATPDDIARYHNSVPRNPATPPPEQPDIAATRARTNADKDADDFVDEFIGQNPRLGNSPRLPGDLSAYLAAMQRNDKAKGMTIERVNKALGRRDDRLKQKPTLLEQIQSGVTAPGTAPAVPNTPVVTPPGGKPIKPTAMAPTSPGYGQALAALRVQFPQASEAELQDIITSAMRQP